MEKDISLEALKSHKIESDSIPSGSPEHHKDSDNIDTVPEEENKDDTVEENQNDVMVYLSKELDEKSLFEKFTYFKTEWTRKTDMFKKTKNSKGSFALNVFMSK